ncbi:MAG: FAD-dependent oxidoreductase [Actinomycetota bacterium]
MRSARAGTSVRACDVLVVGGGSAGLFLGALLARRDVDVVVLERRTEPGTHSRAIGLHPPALAALQVLGMTEAALAEGVPIERGVGRSRGHLLGHLAFDRVRADFPFVLALPQHRTEALLAHRLEELAPGALQRGWEVRDVQDGSGAAHVAAARTPVSPAEPGAGTVAGWRARVVVGADGARSTVRARAGIGTRLKPYPDTYLMGDFADTTDDRSTAAIHLEPGGVVESFPLPGRVRRWVVHTGSVPADPCPEDLAALVEHRTGEQLEPASSTMISAFTVRRQLARRMVAGRQVLTGDAAHEISPIGGQGMTLGWLDALALAPLLEQLAADDVGRPLQEIPCFRDFERTRLRAARTAARVAHVNMALGRPVPAPVGRARDVALRGVLGTPLRHRLARTFTMGWA